MLRSFLFAVLLLLPLSSRAQTAPQELASSIERVTVFLRGAQVTRTARASLPAGTAELRFTDLPPSLAPERIQLEAQGDFTILSVVPRTNYLEPPAVSAAVQALETRREALHDSLQLLRAQIEVYDQEAQLLLQNQQLGGSQTGLAVDNLKAAADFFRSRLTEIKRAQLALRNRLNALNEVIRDLQNQIGELQPQRGRQTTEVTVAVRAEGPTQASFALSYVTPQAGWAPHYDLRVADVDGPIALTYNANVSQATGEDWTDVDLTLSTGDPSRAGTKPDLRPWRLGFADAFRPAGRAGGGSSRVVAGPPVQNPTHIRGRVLDAQTGEPLVGANVIVEGTQNGTTVDMNGMYQLNLSQGGAGRRISARFVGYRAASAPLTSDVVDFFLAPAAMELSEVVVTGVDGDASSRARSTPSADEAEAEFVQVQATQTTVTTEFAVALPATIPADGKPQTVQLAREDVPAAYEYYAAPKLDEAAYLTALVPGWEAYDLITGEANLFFEGTYVGQTLLDTDATEDTLVVSLGQDPGVVVERTKERTFAERQFIGNRQTETRAFSIDVRNTKRVPVTVVVEDQVPVSTDERIDVRDVEAGGGTYDEATGLLRWRLELEPGAAETLRFSYEVRYPKGRRVVLE